MTDVERRDRDGAPVADDRVPARWWLAPRSLWLHTLLLAFVLAAVAGVIGPHARYTSDEGAVLITARSVAAGDGWLVGRPLQRVDPTGANFPLLSSDWGSKGVSAFAKHPTYPALLAVAERAWPDGGVVAVSVIGTVLAAALSAVLAARLSSAIAVGTFWLVGVASPLLVDSQLLIAHTLGAALAVAAVLAADSARTATRGRMLLWSASVSVFVALLALVRTEGLLLAPGLALAAFVVCRREWLRASVISAAAFGGVAVALVVDRLARRAVLGEIQPYPGIVTVPDETFLAGRAHSMFTTLLRPGYLGGTGGLLLVAMVGCLVISLVALLRRKPDATMALVFLLLAAVAALVRGAVISSDSVPGLLIAFPAMWLGLIGLGRGTWADDRRRLLAVTSAVTVLGVIATQYSVGGTVEWGGRYFAFVIPVVAPLAALGLQSLWHRFEPSARPVAAAAFVALVVALAVLGVRDQRTTQRGASTFVEGVTVAGRAIGPDPVMVTTQGIVPRLAFKTYPDQRWLLVEEKHPNHLVDRLRKAGIDRFVLVTDDAERDAPVVEGATKRSETTSLGWRFQIYDISPT